MMPASTIPMITATAAMSRGSEVPMSVMTVGSVGLKRGSPPPSAANELGR